MLHNQPEQKPANIFFTETDHMNQVNKTNVGDKMYQRTKDMTSGRHGDCQTNRHKLCSRIKLAKLREAEAGLGLGPIGWLRGLNRMHLPAGMGGGQTGLFHLAG